MDYSVVTEQANPLMQRTDVTLRVEHPYAATPSREEIQQQYAAAEGIAVARVELAFVQTEFGTHTSTAAVKVWDHPRDALQPAEEDASADDTEGEETEDAHSETGE